MASSSTELTMRIGGEGLDLDEIDRQTRALRDMLEEEMVADSVTIPHSAAKPGEKGIPLAIGALIVAALKSGAIGAFVSCLTAIFNRQHSLSISIRDTDGREVQVNATNVNDDKVMQFLREATARSRRSNDK